MSRAETLALPRPHSAPDFERLNTWLNGLPPEALIGFSQPTAQDFAVFGAIIQIFNSIELNLRRSPAAFEAGGVLPERTLPTSALSPKQPSGLRGAEVRSGLIAAIRKVRSRARAGA